MVNVGKYTMNGMGYYIPNKNPSNNTFEQVFSKWNNNGLVFCLNALKENIHQQ